jgi:hypothetical protein
MTATERSARCVHYQNRSPGCLTDEGVLLGKGTGMMMQSNPCVYPGSSQLRRSWEGLSRLGNGEITVFRLTHSDFFHVCQHHVA